MKDYSTQKPSFSESVNLLETTDTNHADNFNKATMQLFENTVYNKNIIEKMQEEGFQITDDKNGTVYKLSVKGGVLCLKELNEDGDEVENITTSTNWQASFPEFTPKTTTFNDDGSITEKLLDAEGNLQATKTTVFNADGSITEKLYDADENLQATKTTTFNDDGSITETVI